MVFDPNAFEASLRESGLGPPEEEKEPFLEQAWDAVTTPIKALTATQNVGAQLAGLLDPEAYAAAARHRAEGLTPEKEKGLYGLFRKAEALPGLGDVIAETSVGKALGETPFIGQLGGIGRLAGNIAGDPLTWASLGASTLTKLGAAENLAGKAAAALKAAEATGDAEKIRLATSKLGAANLYLDPILKAASPTEKLVARLGQAGQFGEGIGAATAADATLGQRMLGLTQAGLSAPTSPLVGVAYAPGIVEGIKAGAEQTLAEARAGRPVEALGAGVNTALQAGLANMVRKGVIHEWKARKVAARAMQDAIPDKQNVEPVQPATPQEYQQAVNDGDIPPTPTPPAEPGPTPTAPEPMPPLAEPPPPGPIAEPPPFEYPTMTPEQQAAVFPPDPNAPIQPSPDMGPTPQVPPQPRFPRAPKLAQGEGPALAEPSPVGPLAEPPPFEPPAPPAEGAPPPGPPPPAPRGGGEGGLKLPETEPVQIPPDSTVTLPAATTLTVGPDGTVRVARVRAAKPAAGPTRHGALTDAVRAVADAAPEGTELTVKGVTKALRDQGVEVSAKDVKERLPGIIAGLEGWEQKKGGGRVRKAAPEAAPPVEAPPAEAPPPEAPPPPPAAPAAVPAPKPPPPSAPPAAAAVEPPRFGMGGPEEIQAILDANTPEKRAALYDKHIGEAEELLARYPPDHPNRPHLADLIEKMKGERDAARAEAGAPPPTPTTEAAPSAAAPRPERPLPRSGQAAVQAAQDAGITIENPWAADENPREVSPAQHAALEKLGWSPAETAWFDRKAADAAIKDNVGPRRPGAAPAAVAPEPPPPPSPPPAAAAAPRPPAPAEGEHPRPPRPGPEASSTSRKADEAYYVTPHNKMVRIKSDINVGDSIAGRKVAGFDTDGRVVFEDEAAIMTLLREDRRGPAAAPEAEQTGPGFTEGRGEYQKDTIDAARHLFKTSLEGGAKPRTVHGADVIDTPGRTKVVAVTDSKGNTLAAALLAPNGTITDWAASKLGSPAAVRVMRAALAEGGKIPAIEHMSPDSQKALLKLASRLGIDEAAIRKGNVSALVEKALGGRKKAAPSKLPPAVQATHQAATDLGVPPPAAPVAAAPPPPPAPPPKPKKGGKAAKGVKPKVSEMTREQVLAEKGRLQQKGAADEAEWQRLMADPQARIPESLHQRRLKLRGQQQELTARLAEIDAEGRPAKAEEGGVTRQFPRTLSPEERKARLKSMKKAGAAAFAGKQKIPPTALPPERPGLTPLQRGPKPEAPPTRVIPESERELPEPRPPRPGAATLLEPTAEAGPSLKEQKFDDEGNLIQPDEELTMRGTRVPYEVAGPEEAALGSPGAPEGFPAPPPVQGLSHEEATRLYGTTRTPEEAARIATALTGAEQADVARGSPINFGQYPPDSVAGRVIGWLRGKKGLDLGQAEAEDILQNKLTHLSYGTLSQKHRVLPMLPVDTGFPETDKANAAENVKRAAENTERKAKGLAAQAETRALLDRLAKGDETATAETVHLLKNAIRNDQKTLYRKQGVAGTPEARATIENLLPETPSPQEVLEKAAEEAIPTPGMKEFNDRLNRLPGASTRDKNIFRMAKTGNLSAEETAAAYNSRPERPVGEEPITADTVYKILRRVDLSMAHPSVSFENNGVWKVRKLTEEGVETPTTGLGGTYKIPKKGGVPRLTLTSDPLFKAAVALRGEAGRAAVGRDFDRVLTALTDNVPRGTSAIEIVIPKDHPVRQTKLFQDLVLDRQPLPGEKIPKLEHPVYDDYPLVKVPGTEDVYRLRKVTRERRTALDDLRARETARVPSEHLSPQDLQARANSYAGKLDEAYPVGDKGAVAVDFDGDAADALAGHAALGPLADALSDVTAGLSEAGGHDVSFGGFAPSAHLDGVYFKGKAYSNAASAVRWAQQMLDRSGNATPDNIRKVASARLFSQVLHEINHGAVAGHGPEFAAQRLALIKAYLPHVRDAMASIERSIDLDAMAPLVDDLGRRIDVVSRPEPPAPGRPPAPAPPEPYRPTPGPGGGEGRPGGYPGGRPQPEGAYAGGVRGAVGRAEGAPPPGGPALPEGRARAPSPGEAGPREGPFDQVAESVRTARDAGEAIADTTEKVSPEVALDLAAFWKGHEDKLKVPLDDYLKAGPQRNVDIPINMERVDLPGISNSDRATLSSIVQEMHGDRGGPLKWEMIDRQVREMLGANSPDEIVARLKASGLRTPAQVKAARDIYATFASDVGKKRAALDQYTRMGAGDEVIRGAQTDLGQSMARLIQAQDVLAPGATTAGRILNTFRMLASPISEGETFAGRFKGALRAADIRPDQVEKLYGMYNDALSGKISDEGFLKALRDATSPSRLDKVLEFWKAGLLGWPTQISNISSNGMFQGINRVEEGIAAAMDAVRAGVTGTKRERYFGELPVRIAAQKKALAEALNRWKGDMVDAATLKAADLDRIKQLGTFDPRRVTGAIGGKWGEFVRIPFKSLDAADNFYKYIAQKGEHAARAYRLAQDEAWRLGGETAKQAEARILTEMEDATDRPLTSKHYEKYRDHLADAQAAVKRSVFQGPLQESALGRFAKMISQASSTPGFKWLQFLVPFTHTPANILHELTVRTPLGFANVYRKWKNGQFEINGKLDQGKVLDELAKATFGSVALGGLLGMGLDGHITGSGPDDPNEQESLKATGWQPYSMKVGNQYVSYQRFEPIASLMGFAGDMAEAYKRGEIHKPRELMDRAFASVAQNYTNKSFLSGLEGVFSAWHDPSRYFPALIKQLQGSAVPNVLGPIPVATLARAMDPTYRQTEALTMSPFLARIPGLSQTLPEQLTPLGAVRERQGTFVERLLSPVARTEVKTGPGAEAAKEFDRLQWAPRKPERVMKFPDGTKVELTNQEMQIMAGAQEKAIEVASRIIKSPEYAQLPDEEDITGRRVTKKDVLQRIISNYQRQALARVRPGLLKRGVQQERMASQ